MIAFTENLAGESAKSRIEKGARSYNELRGELAAVIGELNEKIEALTLKKLPLIKKLAGRAAEKHKELETAILAAPQLFEKPRTAVFHGIKCGFRKTKAALNSTTRNQLSKKSSNSSMRRNLTCGLSPSQTRRRWRHCRLRS